LKRMNDRLDEINTTLADIQTHFEEQARGTLMMCPHCYATNEDGGIR